MFITKKGLTEPYEVQEEDEETGRRIIMFSHEDLDCIIAYVQKFLERNVFVRDPLQIDLYFRYQKGHHSKGFSAIHMSNTKFVVGKTEFKDIQSVLEHCEKNSPTSFRVTLTLNRSHYAFDQWNLEAKNIYHSLRH